VDGGVTRSPPGRVAVGLLHRQIEVILVDRLTLENPDGFGGDYLRYAKTTVERASDCWID
jgi:hypothetical protein